MAFVLLPSAADSCAKVDGEGEGITLLGDGRAMQISPYLAGGCISARGCPVLHIKTLEPAKASETQIMFQAVHLVLMVHRCM